MTDTAMTERLVRTESPEELFKELVDRAMERQGFRSSEMSAYYLVQLLDRFVADAPIYHELEVTRDARLAELLLAALGSEGARRVKLLRFTGDLALFVSGFFADSIDRRRVDLDYYVRMGGQAYARAAKGSRAELALVFSELATKFSRFVDVLNEVSEESALQESAGVLKLYERWRQTGSRRSARLLREQGILLGQSAGEMH